MAVGGFSVTLLLLPLLRGEGRAAATARTLVHGPLALLWLAMAPWLGALNGNRQNDNRYV